jgi:hypothetical protein
VPGTVAVLRSIEVPDDDADPCVGAVGAGDFEALLQPMMKTARATSEQRA